MSSAVYNGKGGMYNDSTSGIHPLLALTLTLTHFPCASTIHFPLTLTIRKEQERHDTVMQMAKKLIELHKEGETEAHARVVFLTKEVERLHAINEEIIEEAGCSSLASVLFHFLLNIV